MSPAITSTHQLSPKGFATDSYTPLVVGPYWKSFEDFRTDGNAGLERIPEHGAGVLRCKAGTFRILRDIDFQRIVGLAADVHRLQNGLKVVLQAAKVAVKHPDQDHIQLLMHSASMVAECPELPQQQGHLPFEISPQAPDEEHDEEFDITTANIPRPTW